MASRGPDTAIPGPSSSLRCKSWQSGGRAQCRRESRDPDRRGSGRGCRRDRRRSRRRLGAGVAKALLGKTVLPDDLPVRHRRDRAARHSAELRPDERLRHITDDWHRLPMVGVPAEGRRCARGADRHRPGHALAPLPVRGQPPRQRRRDAARCSCRCSNRSGTTTGARRIKGWLDDWWETLEARAKTKAHPVNPQRVVWEMSPRLPENAIVTSDSGSCANWYARDFRVKRGPDGVAIGRARIDGGGCALCDRRQVRASRTGRSSRSSATARCR